MSHGYGDGTYGSFTYGSLDSEAVPTRLASTAFGTVLLVRTLEDDVRVQALAPSLLLTVRGVGLSLQVDELL